MAGFEIDDTFVVFVFFAYVKTIGDDFVKFFIADVARGYFARKTDFSVRSRDIFNVVFFKLRKIVL